MPNHSVVFHAAGLLPIVIAALLQQYNSTWYDSTVVAVGLAKGVACVECLLLGDDAIWLIVCDVAS